MMMLRPQTIAVLAMALAACGAPAQPTSRALQPIVGGADDPGDPEVVALLVDGWPACSGTLVSPTAVLTAGHCANLIGTSDKYAVAFGSDASQPTRRVQVVEQVTHPQYTAMGAPYDFAMLRLAQPVTDVAPAVLGTAPLSQADVGAPIRHVGFGVSDEAAGTGRGIKRTVTYAITEVDPDVVWSGGSGQTCEGDSGGPGFLGRDGGEQLVGVVSDGPNCHDAGWDGRADLVADWVGQTAAAWAPPDAGAPDAGPPREASPNKGGGCASADGAALLALLAALLWLSRTARS